MTAFIAKTMHEQELADLSLGWKLHCEKIEEERDRQAETIRCMSEVFQKIADFLGVETGDVDGLLAEIEGLKNSGNQENRPVIYLPFSLMKALAKEISDAADIMGGSEEPDNDTELAMAIFGAGIIPKDENSADTYQNPVIGVWLTDYPEEGAYFIDPFDKALAAGEAK